MQNPAMKNELIQRIDEVLKERDETRSRASVGAGLGASYIRDLERKTGNPNLSKLSKLATYLKVPLDRLLPTANIDTPNIQGVASLPVVGTIAAGAFMDISIRDQGEPQEYITVATNGRFPHARQYALKVQGDSMNLKYPDGTYVTCVDFAESGLQLKNGMAVHIERLEGHLVETTLKIVEFVRGQLILSPRSTNVVHKPIIFEPDDGRSDVMVKGIVTGSWRPEEF